ncbi:MAG: hypothetical protein ACFB0B_20040 [Thermonemataceae bacterium]
MVVFWGAFEQAGGLMNVYAREKIDRAINFLTISEIPASVFQSVNAFFIITLGASVASFWVIWKQRGRESSSLFKMAIGTIIMGLGFLFMAGASVEASAEPFGKAAMYWLILAYLFHTVGELCASPVALSFITKLAPLKYASIMMGVYFAATGLGNKVAGLIGESAQTEPIEMTYAGTPQDLKPYESNYQNIQEDKSISFRVQIYEADGQLVMQHLETQADMRALFQLEEKNLTRLKEIVEERDAIPNAPLHASLELEKDLEAKKVKENKGDGKDYEGKIRVMEVENETELNTFIFITIFTVSFGLLLIFFLKPLKRLTHGVEEREA